MPILGNSAKFGIGATPNYVAHGKNITWDPGKRNLPKSEDLSEEVPTLYNGSRSNAQVTLTVAHDKADTNGQVALNTAFKSGTTVACTLAPEGTTVGNEKITGTARVESIGSMSMDKDQIVMRNVVLIVSGDYTEGVFS
jgi:hypothetical protein